ncbi:hypothetical protein TNCV_3342551 [Trichonephila clavipes]|nr:hypothetical protein TNCV_3342551 [Trichonephila clavipes]
MPINNYAFCSTTPPFNNLSLSRSHDIRDLSQTIPARHSNPNVDSALSATVPSPRRHQSQAPFSIQDFVYSLTHSLRHLAEREWQRIVMRLLWRPNWCRIVVVIEARGGLLQAPD